MKLAIVTDLHANREAVEAVMAHARAQGFDRLTFLGDFVGYGADPAWVVDFVQEQVAAGAYAVQGNHDAAAVRGPLPSMREDAVKVVDWTRSQLTPAQLDFLRKLPLHVEYEDCLFVHANAFAPADWGYIEGRMEAMRSLQATERAYAFCGHMHEPMLYHLSLTHKTGQFEPTPGVPIPLSPARRWLVLPGSCGQPRDGNPAASYALFDCERAELIFHRVPYDHEAAGRKILEAGLPPAFAERLKHGT